MPSFSMTLRPRPQKPKGTGPECGFQCHTDVAAQDYIFTAYPAR